MAHRNGKGRLRSLNGRTPAFSVAEVGSEEAQARGLSRPVLTRVQDKQSWGGGARPTPGEEMVRLRHSLLSLVDGVCGLDVTTPPCIRA